MYCDYYGFREKPFQITPNPRFLYLSRNHREAFAHLLYGINSHAGFMELTGEVGTGKTTVLRTILEQLDDSTHKTALILNPCLSALELLRSINREFGIPHEGMETGTLLDELNRFLLSENSEGRTIVLVIDEAQNLSPQVLEQIRLISNLETETDKLIQIVLAGQPELQELLERKELRQLSQRVTVRYHLLPMDQSDSSAYIRHRLRVAGAEGKVTFTGGAVKRIFAHAKGAPRLINIACDRALLVGYGEGTREISAKIAAIAIAELKRGRKPSLLSWQRITAVAAILSIIALVLAAMHRTSSGNPHKRDTEAAAQKDALATLPQGPYPAVNAVLQLWGAKEAENSAKSLPIAAIFKEQGFSTIAVDTLSNLVKLDTPAIVEIDAGKGKGTRLIALISVEGTSFRFAPPLQDSSNISMGELAAVWTGRGQIIWRNSLGISNSLKRDAEGAGVAGMQKLLLEAGLMKGEATGRLDRPTREAVKSLQAAAGLVVDGIPGDRTLLVMYRDHGKNRPPRLSQTRGERS